MEKRPGTQTLIDEAAQHGKDLRFSGLKFTTPIIIKEKTLDGATFVDCDFEVFKMEGCYFSQNVVMLRCNIENEFTIQGTKFYTSLVCRDIKAKEIDLSQVIVNEAFFFEAYDCVNNANFSIIETKTLVSISQNRNDLITRTKTKTVLFDFNDVEGKIRISDIWCQLFIADCEYSSNLNDIGISRVMCDRFEISHLKNSGPHQVLIEDIETSCFYLSNCSNQGSLNIKNIKGDKSDDSFFKIEGSYLGDCEIYDLDFNLFRRIYIARSHIQKIIPVNVTWNFKRYAYSEEKEIQLRELFRQMKIVCSANSDKISSMRFEKLEMFFYTSELGARFNKKYNSRWIALKEHCLNFFDYFILWSNKWSNDYGQNWFRSFALLCGFTFVFYFALVASADKFDTWHFGRGAAFLNPAHTLKEILSVEEIANPWTYFWDMCQRVFSGYFIFQFLRAFRKFVN